MKGEGRKSKGQPLNLHHLEEMDKGTHPSHPLKQMDSISSCSSVAIIDTHLKKKINLGLPLIFS